MMHQYPHKLIQIILDYVHRRLSERQFLILSSILVGITAGLAAVVLKWFVHNINTLVFYYSTNYEEFFLFTLFPLIGLVLTVFVTRFFFKNEIRKGSSEVVFSIVKKSSVLPSSQMYSQLITSALTVGFGGSTGLESPLVSTGSAIGSNYAQTYKLGYKERTILLACGAAAGIAAAFNAPIAGVLFAVEVLLTDVTVGAFIPLIIAAASGALLSNILLGEGVLLSFSLQQPFNYEHVPYYILLGITAGLVSLYYSRTFIWMERRISVYKQSYARAVIGGLILSLLLIIFPPLFGEGYESIKVLATLHPEELTRNSVLFCSLDNPWTILIFLVLLMLIKVFATGITLNSGGVGGNFGPSLFVGAYLGFVFSRIVNLSGLSKISESNFTLVAMAGILSGVFHAPLTGIFLIAEITGGYGLMIPLMIVSAISMTVVRSFDSMSMDARKVALKLKVAIDDRDKFLLSRLDLADMIETNFKQVHPDDSLRLLVKAISESNRNMFPVVNENEELVGVIHLDMVRDIIFNATRYDEVTVRELMAKPSAVVSPEETLHSVLKKFDETNHWSLPVVENKKYKGFLSKSSILSKYRNELLKTV